MRQEHGTDILVREALENVRAQKLVIDGIRNTGEIAYLRNRYGYHFTLLGVVQTFEARWDRMGTTLYTDDKDGQKAFFTDDARDQSEETDHGQQVRKCIDQADILIDNSEVVTLGGYKRKVLNYAVLASGEDSRTPSREEIFMNMAYSACHSSRCLKRHVGAVVLLIQAIIPLELATTTIPDQDLPCEEQYHRCFKDMLKEDLLNQLAEENRVPTLSYLWNPHRTIESRECGVQLLCKKVLNNKIYR